MPQELTFDISRDGGRATVVLAGDLDMAGTLRLEPETEALLEDPGIELLVLDLQGVDFIDSVGLRLLVETHNESQRAGCRLALVHGSRNVRRIVEIAGYEGFLPFTDERAAT